MNIEKIRVNCKKSDGLSQIALIGTIVGIIILIAVIVVLAFGGKKNQDSNTNNTNTNENDDFFTNETVNETKNETAGKNDTKKDYLDKDGVDIDELFDSTGEEEGKLHIGDFVDYTAGNWTSKEIEKIDTNGERKKPTSSFKFGGYEEGDSRDKSVVPCDENYNYVKEKNSSDKEQSITGWRIFDVNDDEIVLISAGCPEDYYHPAEGRSAYISQYILTGKVNENCRAEWLGLGDKYKKRTWKEYVNKDYYATRANSISKTVLDDWYNKYIGKGIDTWKNEDFQKVYDTTYENLIDNYAYYWLPDSYSESNIYGFFPYAKVIGNSTNKYGNVFGVRILVYLPRDIKFKEDSIGTKTILSRDKEYEYNIWEISR